MAEPEGGKIVTQKNGEEEKPRNPFSFFQLKLPFFNQEKKELKDVGGVVTKKGDENGSVNRRNFVSFPNSRQIVTSPLETEYEESSGTTHNPVFIWQVYALGGFIILKWVWARWQERAKKAPSDDDDQSPADADE